MFERFSSAGRRVVVQAEREARGLGHDFIGTEHLLLALAAPVPNPAVGGQAAQLLAAYGLDVEELRAAVVETVGLGDKDLPEGESIPFTPRSKKVLELSLREALAARSRTIEPQHVLFGILREGDGVGARLLKDRGVTLDAARSTLGGGPWPAPMRRLRSFRAAAFPGMTTGALRVIAEARKAAGKGTQVGTHHLLMALIDEGEGLAARVLDQLGVTRAEVEAAVADLGVERTSDSPASKVEVEIGEAVTITVADPELLERLKAVKDVDLQIKTVVMKAINEALEGSEGQGEGAG